MAKFTDPTGNSVIYLTQTGHGETHTLPDTQYAIDIAMKANEYFHSVCDGVVELTTSSGGGYISIIPTGMNARVLYVHTNRYLVKKGDKVKAGQKLGQIQDMKGSHLHIGMKNKDNSSNPPRIMDYFDRSLNFKTNYADIAKDWFVNGKLNWSLFKDLQYGVITPPEAPEITELKKQITALNESIDKLEKTTASQKAQITTLENKVKGKEEENKTLSEELDTLQKKYDVLYVEKNRIENEKDEAIRKLNEYKNGRFMWVVDFLEKVFPKKKDI